MAKPKLDKRYKVCRPITPNKGLEIAYRRKLEELIDDMYRSIFWWIGAEYKKEQAKILEYADPAKAAQDASPANAMLSALKKRFSQWRKEYNKKARQFGYWFANVANKTTTNSTGQSIGQALGLTVKFKPTRAMQNAMASIINENVSLIKTIPQRCFQELEGLVMRSVRAGRDIGELTKEIKERYGVTRRRAAFIASDQNNKATEALSRIRMQELGFNQAKWIHVTRSKYARHSHIDMDGKIFDLNQGIFDDEVGRFIHPGELPRCRCQKAPVLSMLPANARVMP